MAATGAVDGDMQRSSFTIGAPKEHILDRLKESGRAVVCKNDSEDVAALIHLFLSVSI